MSFLTSENEHRAENGQANKQQALVHFNFTAFTLLCEISNAWTDEFGRKVDAIYTEWSLRVGGDKVNNIVGRSRIFYRYWKEYVLILKEHFDISHARLESA